MGCGPFSGRKISSSSYDTNPLKSVAPNPNPFNYTIKSSEQIGKFTIAIVNYPDCTTYEGNKILMFVNTNTDAIYKQRNLDPHFSSSTKFLSPVARFEPTALGLTLARTLANTMSGIKL